MACAPGGDPEGIGGAEEKLGRLLRTSGCAVRPFVKARKDAPPQSASASPLDAIRSRDIAMASEYSRPQKCGGVAWKTNAMETG